MQVAASMLLPVSPMRFALPPDVSHVEAWYPDRGLGITKSAATSVAFNTVGTTLLSIAPTTGAAAPFVAAAGAIAMLGGQIARMFDGCGPTCVQSTEFANKFGATLDQIKSTYWSTPTPRPKALQTATLEAIDNAIKWLNQACSDPSLGPAGQRCISERTVRGGTAPWCPTPDHKGCDVYSVYRDPIANDPDVVADPPNLSELTGGLMGGGSSSMVPLLIGAGLLTLLVIAL